MWSRSTKEGPGAGSELEGEGGRQWGQKGNRALQAFVWTWGFIQSKETSESFWETELNDRASTLKEPLWLPHWE